VRLFKNLHIAAFLLILGVLTTSAGAAQEGVLHTVDSDGHPMAVWEKSPENPKGVVLLLHGRTWSGVPDFDLQVQGEELSLMDGLVAEGWSTFALDQRGYGATPRDATGWLSPDRAARDLINVLDWLWTQTGEGDRPVLFGWSQGSMVSQLTVQRRPDLVSMVALFGYPVTPGLQLSAREHPDQAPRVANTAENAASDFIIPGSISQAAIDAYVEQSLAADPFRVDWRRNEEWNELDPAKITTPLLLLQGEHDPFAPTENQALFFSQLGTADREWVTVPGGDHAAFMESPRAYFIDALVAFMERRR
jgi:pimeloyl-ACP methyl ester carboxylesterase